MSRLFLNPLRARSRSRSFILILLFLPVVLFVLIRASSVGAETAVSFGSPTTYNIGTGPYWTATFNKFGKPAIAVTNQDDNSVSVLYGSYSGQFNGTFGLATSYNLVTASVPAPAPQQIVAGNLGQLSLPSLVIAAAGANKVAVLLGNSDDSFQPPVYYNVGSFPESVAVGDVNGDSNLDIVAANYGSSTISVLLGNSDRTFQAQQTYATSPNPESIVVADFNNDGKVDVATVNSGTNPGKVNVLLNVNGTFPNAVTSDVGVNPFSLAVGDFNNDGKADIVTANHGGGVSLLLNNGVRPFAAVAPAPISAGSDPFSVAVADFNLDGRADIAVSNGDNGGSVGILPNSNGSFQALQTLNDFSIGPNPLFIAVGDFNVDGKPDLVAPNHPDPVVNPGTISVLLNTFAPFVAPPANDNFVNAAVLPPTLAGRVTGTNAGATREANEPQHATLPGASSVWFRWTAPATGGATFDTFASSFDTVLAVYTGAAYGALTEVASGDNDVGSAGDPRVTSRIKFNAVAGTTYNIVIDSGGFTTATGNITLNWSLHPPPANDNFVNAEALPATTSGGVTGTNLGASKEAGEPNHAGSIGGASVWYQWTPPIDGTYIFKTSGSVINGFSSYDTLLSIYTGSAVNNLTPIPCGTNTPCPSNDDESFLKTSRVVFTASHDVTYQIAVDSKGSAKSNIILSWTPAITTGPITISGDSGFSTNPMNADSLTYQWTPTHSGTITFTCSPFSGSSGNQTTCKLSGGGGIFKEGSCKFTPLICQASTLQFNATGGTTYGINVSRFPGSTGSAQLSWGLSPAATNDNFANAEVILGFNGFTPVNTVGATNEPGEPLDNSGFPASGVWYKWVAPANCTIAFSVQRPEPPFLQLGVFTGSSVTQLTTITRGIENVSFNAEKDTTYYIRVDRPGILGSLRWSSTSVPDNDNFALRQLISGQSGSVTATNANATKEATEGNHAGNPGGASVWFTWTPQVSGIVTFNTDRSTFNTLLAVYVGSDVGTLSEVVSNDNESANSVISKVTFFAIAGTTYQVVVDGWRDVSSFPSTGGISLNWGVPRSISGRISDIRGAGIANVQVKLSGDSSLQRLTDASGNYTFSDLVQGRSYTVTPSSPLFTFGQSAKIDERDKPTRTYNPLTVNVTDANFVALTPTYFITGKLTRGGVALANIKVNLEGSDIPANFSVLTNSNGKYTFTDLTSNGDFKVTPSSSEYTFNATLYPANNFYEFKTLNEPQSNMDFAGTATPKTLDVRSENPTAGVGITITPNDNNGQPGGPTPLTRVFNDGTPITLTASPTANGNNFQKWLKNGADFSTSLSIPVTMDANHTMTAVYVPPTRTLTVASTNPDKDVDITITPTDNNSQGGAKTQFTRTYNIDRKVTLTAPLSVGNGTFQRWQKDGSDYSNSLATDVTMDANHTMTAVYLTTSSQTPAGQNVKVELNGVTVSFANVSTAGTTTILPISPASAGQLPNGYQLNTGIAFDISTTANVQPPISVCFNVPSISDPTLFAQLRLLHNENGSLVDRTTSLDFTTRMVCATVNSLSPFVLVSTTMQQLQLLLDESATPPTLAIALDNILLVRDPFPIVNPANALTNTDKNTRVMVFVRGLPPGDTAAAITVHLAAANGLSLEVPAEYLYSPSGFDFTQLTFRLPDAIAAGSCSIEVRAHGLVSNLGTIRIK